VRENLYKKILKNDLAIILLFFSLFVLGIFSLFHMKITTLPRHSRPALTMITDYYGMEPETIEQVITRPLERLLKEVRGVKDIESFSLKGQSRIVISLDPAADVDEEAVLIMDRVYHVSRNFPKEVRDSALYRYNTDDSPAAIISLAGRGQSDELLYRLAESRIKEELLSVDEVANVETTGPGKKDYFIVQDYENMSRLGGKFDTAFKHVVAGNVSVPLGSLKSEANLVSLDFPNTYSNLFNLPAYPGAIRGTTGSGYDLFSVRKMKREGVPLSFVDNNPSLILYIFKKDFSSVLAVDRGIRRILENWDSAFSFTYLFNQAVSFRNLLMQLLIGSATAFGCIIALLIIFYKRVLFVWLPLVAILLCLSGTLALLALFGGSLNIMTLSALIVGIGICIDNTLIVIEPLQMAMKKAAKREFRTGLNSIDGKGSISRIMARVYRPLLASTITTVVVFVPLFFMNGEAVSLYADFARAISIMLILSCLVSVFFIPCAVHRFFVSARVDTIAKIGRRRTHHVNQKTKGKKNALADFPLAVTKTVLKQPLFSFALLFLCAAVFTLLFINLDFRDISPVKEKKLIFFYEFDPQFNTSYREVAVKSIGDTILNLGFPLTLVSKLENERATFFIGFPAHYRRYKIAVRKLQSHISAIKRNDGFFHYDSGEDAGAQHLRLFFFGGNLERLNTYVDGVTESISEWPGVDRILKGYKMGKPEIEFHIDSKRLYFFDLNVVDVTRFLRYVFYYPVIMKHYENGEMMDVRGRIEVEGLTRQKLGLLHVPGNSGKSVSLADFSTIGYQQSPGVITRKNGKRCIPVDIQYEGMKEKDFAGSLREYLGGVDFHDDFYYEFSKNLIERQKSRMLFVLTLVIAVFSVYTILGIILKSFGLPVMVISSIPSLFVGGYLFLIAGGYNRSVPAHIGLILLIGLSVNSVILLLEEMLGLQTENVSKKRMENIILLSLRRKMRIIALMLLTTVLSMIPVFLFTSSAYFFRILSGVIFSGLLIGIPFSVLLFSALYRIFYLHFRGR